jgi:hypothetical protein
VAGCSIGPSTVSRDRFDYSAAIAESWKRQMLLNLVKLRYGDPPVFLDVGQVVSGYTVQSTFTALGNVFSTNGPVPGVPNSSVGLSAQGQFIDRPTVTYAPLVGERFARSLMTPIPPPALMNLIQAGNPLTSFCGSACTSSTAFATVTAATPGRPVGMRSFIRSSSDFDGFSFLEPSACVCSASTAKRLSMSFRRGADPSVEAEIIAARQLLGRDPTASDFRVVYGAVAANNREIAILSRSILEILVDLSSFISVPDQDVAEQRVSATAEPEMGPSGPIRPLIRIGSSPDRPSDAFVAVPYRNGWFWIDDRDIPSKRLFAFLMFVFTLVETGTKESPPIITIPAG